MRLTRDRDIVPILPVKGDLHERLCVGRECRRVPDGLVVSEILLLHLIHWSKLSQGGWVNEAYPHVVDGLVYFARLIPPRSKAEATEDNLCTTNVGPTFRTERCDNWVRIVLKGVLRVSPVKCDVSCELLPIECHCYHDCIRRIRCW